MTDRTKQRAGRLTWRSFGYAVSPALFYTLLSSAVYSLLAVSGPDMPGIRLQAVSVAACLVFFGWLATKEQVSFKSPKRNAYYYPGTFCYVMAAVMCGLANNYLYMVIQSKLEGFSAGYGRVAEVFYHNSLAEEIVTLCILAPIAEELVYRGFVYQRLRGYASETAAAVLSALVFGAFHFNLVQFAYASVLGAVLAHIVYKTKGLAAAVAAHMGANLVSVLWTETDWLDFLDMDGMGQYLAAALCMVLTGIFLSNGNRLMKTLLTDRG